MKNIITRSKDLICNKITFIHSVIIIIHQEMLFKLVNTYQSYLKIESPFMNHSIRLFLFLLPFDCHYLSKMRGVALRVATAPSQYKSILHLW